jgi:hypothetical protein
VHINVNQTFDFYIGRNIMAQAPGATKQPYNPFLDEQEQQDPEAKKPEGGAKEEGGGEDKKDIE